MHSAWSLKLEKFPFAFKRLPVTVRAAFLDLVGDAFLFLKIA